MDENFNPNRNVYGSNIIDGLGKASIDETSVTPRNTEEAAADIDAPLIAALVSLEDGQVAVVGDLVAIRAGPDTYHPIKALKGMASESDVILLSCLTKAPAAGEATSAVRSALQRVIVRAPSVMIHKDGPRGSTPGMATAAAGAAGGPAAHLRAMSPSAHSAVIDGKLLRAFSATRARAILAGLTPTPLSAGGHRDLPTVVAGISAGPSGLCFLGQRASSEGYSSFSIRRECGAEVGEEAATTGQAIRIDKLMMHEYGGGGRAQASARALYDLWGTANGDVLGGSLQEAVDSSPFARLATEWDCSTPASRTLGSAPPPACSSLLLIGGKCPPSALSLALRGEIDTLTAAASAELVVPVPVAQRKSMGPFGCVGEKKSVGVNDNSAAMGAAGDSSASTESEVQDRVRWGEDLERLLNGSENMAELAARSKTEGQSKARDNDGSSEGGGAPHEEDTAVQERKDGGGMGEEEIGPEQDQEGKTFRGDLDFSERLWELAARAADVKGVRAAVESAFHAVGEGSIFPVVSRDNQTAVGCHIREGVAIAREGRYHDARRSSAGGVGLARDDDEKAKAWRARGSVILKDAETLAEVFFELGVYKVTRDLLHWLRTYAGVLSADIDRALPTSSYSSKSWGGNSSGEERTKAPPGSTTDRRIGRLVALADTLDLVALATSYGAPWRQLAHPVFWELFMEPVKGAGGLDGAPAGLMSATETVSYAMVTAGIFQLNAVDEPPVLSGGAARAAQGALEGCPQHLIPQVLSSVTGVESFAELKRLQQERRAKGVPAGDDAAAVFVCEHRFTPWA
ncbi:unnamed protein product [Laminaria digitata]